MTEPTTTTSKSTDLVTESIREQRDSIVENFRNLEAKFNDKFNEVHAIVSVDTNRETWNKALNELQFNILPSLRRQINTLANLLNPSE
ncbi:hypothetical protein PCASD_05149 [Puccinia coronata f. sp. avenae]|uniref:Uncharacterized protein n=1 Tax=Puccinia coronata f. sp. avenae TaxID=200324 RepID=A0A2N5SV28_9BASI|nr:hypothetical protein PCASD_16903 [Puccinia coronata f. sp. avenae]PLW44615.1 hypothetical protein PCASD_05149 [Puccinia coronata f. sp. avenae]